MRISLPCALVALSALTSPSAAFAASPPKGDYGCTYTTLSGTFYAGQLNILSGSTYKVNKKKPKGSYTTRRNRINFKTGAYRTLYYGRWSKVDFVTMPGFTYQIKLYGKKDGKEKLTCSRNRG